jgi:hypothetical protein
MPNKSLDASGGGVFRNLFGAAEGALIRAAASTQTFGLFYYEQKPRLFCGSPASREKTSMSSEGSVGEQRAENAPVYKSTPLRPATIMTTILVWALVVAVIVRVPTWASVFLASLAGASFLAFLVGYVYLFVRDRESLRTGRGRRAALAAAVGERGPLELGAPAVISIPEAEKVAERRPY